MNLAFLVTVAGPLLGAAGWYTQTIWLFWIGVAVCVITLFLNMASGVMKLPVLPALFMVITAALMSPWYVGVGVGLIVWTALESIGEVVGLLREGRLCGADSMLNFFRSLIHPRTKRIPEGFEQAAEIYVNLVKSRIVDAVVVREELLFAPGTTAERNYGVLTALCAYFVARTDAELEGRAVPEPLREHVWSAIPEAVLEEMDFTGARHSLAMRAILGQSGIFRGVIETHGRENATVLAKTLLVMTPAPGVPQSDPQEEADLTARISVLLDQVNLYGRYLDRIAAPAGGDA